MSDVENSDRLAHAVAAHVVADQSALFAFLADPRNHGGVAVERIDTHGAVVFLAGETAYKVKRAVDFPYMDFSTPEKRAAALRHEIEVNRQNAPEIYRDVVPVTREAGARLAIDGEGETVDWVLRMSRFNAENTLDKLAEREGLSPRLLIDLAEAIAAAHAAAPQRMAGPWVEDVGRYVAHNEAAFLAAPNVFPAIRVHELTAASNAHLARLAPLAEARGRQGLVRLCHGDCHLGNIALIDGRPVLFDAIEFDDRIATCDVLYDLAFLLMDLWERDMSEGANLVFNRYLHLTRREADLEALTALPFYMSLRAAIRAMALSAKAANLVGAARDEAESEALRYFETAEMFLEPLDPGLIAIGGLSGSGKSTLAASLASGFGHPPGAVHLRSDLERKAMFGVPETDALPEDAYTREVTEKVYHALCDKARAALASGHGVVVDAVFARAEERETVFRIAEAVEAPFFGLWLEAPAAMLVERVTARSGDASDADAAIVRRQLGYDLGAMAWTRIDAADNAEATLAAALRRLADAADNA